jgi:hypothetical protein
MTTGKIDQMFSLYKMQGHPFGLPFFLHLLIALLFKDCFLFGWRLAILLLFLLIAVFLYRIADNLKILENNLQRFIFSAIAVSYPTAKIVFMGSELVYRTCLAIFIIATYFTISRVIDGEIAPLFKKIIWRLFTLVLFFLSFYTNSILFFYYSLFLIWALKKRKTAFCSLSAILKFVISKLDYLFLPFIFFGIKLIYFPSYGTYSIYNQLRLYPNLIRDTLTCFMQGIFYSLRPLLTILNLPIPTLFSFLLFLSAISYISYKYIITNKIRTARYDLTLLSFGVIFWFFAFFPYAIINRVPSTIYESRHLLLITIPMSLITIAMINIVCRVFMFSPDQKNAIFCLLLYIFAVNNFMNYIEWQFRWVKDRSIMSGIIDNSLAKKSSVFLIHDSTEDYGLVPNKRHWYEWSSFFKMTWGEEKWVACNADKYELMRNEINSLKDKYKGFYNIADLSLKGQAAEMFIDYREGDIRYSPLDRLKLVSKYFYLKFFDKKLLNTFLSNLITVKIIPV